MQFSIVIVTQNRAESLNSTLEAFLRQKNAEACDYEIIVVDNKSDDETKTVVEGLLPHFNNQLRYCLETRQGIPFARNHGIRASRGNWVVFVDDDCIPAEDYLLSLRRIFDQLDKSVGLVGGKIDPLLEDGARLPEWHDLPFFWGPLAILDYGPEPFKIGKEQLKTKDRLFFSANMAVRKELFERYGGINETKLITGDTELCLRLLKEGILGEYRPDLLVRHKIRQQRMSPEAFRRWYYIRGKYRELTFDYTPKLYYPFGVPTWVLRRIAHNYVRSLKAKSFGRKLEMQCYTLFLCGQAVKIAKKFQM